LRDRNRIGAIGKNSHGSTMEVVKYNNSHDITVRFIEKGNYRHTNWISFRDGKVKNVYDKSVYGAGFLGEGKYKPKVNGKASYQYEVWNPMLKRCCSEKFKEKYTTYKDCAIAEEWLNFQNFAKWYDENYYNVDGERMNLDKDILVKGNKLYSPETCVFVPIRINNLFLKRDKVRGDLPIGVIRVKNTEKYDANCINSKGKIIHLKRHNTPEDAFRVYKEFKEQVIKEVAEEYKDKIPTKLYNALLNYQVEITD
jgi:hypothetical protein